MPLKNHQYQSIMRGYDRRQLNNRNLMERRREEVYQEIPRIREIDHMAADASLKNARSLLDGNADAILQLKEELQSLAQEKRELLAANHFDEDYLEPVYTCPECRDTGYMADGQKCHCFIQASIDLLYTQSNIREILEEENFNTFRLDLYSDAVNEQFGCSPLDAATKAVETAKTFIRRFPYEYRNLILCGNTGIGKTFITHCIAKELLEQSHSVLYFSSSQLFEQLSKATFSKGEESYESSVKEDIAECELLIIDDLGTELTNAFVASSLFTCLNERHIRKKSTVISTNLSLKAIREKYSERIFSRLSLNYTLIKLFGDDIRVKKRLSNLE